MRVGWALAALGFLTASCSASQLQPDASGQLPTDAADAAVPPGGFVTGDVDGVTIRAEQQALAYWFTGIQEGFLGIEARTDEWQWVLVLRNTAGRLTCPSDGYIVLQSAAAGPFIVRATYNSGGGCAVDLTHAAPEIGDVLEGTFTATIVRTSDGAPSPVMNGSFRIPRIAGPG